MDDYIRREDASNWLKQYGQDVLHGKYKFSLMYIWKNIIDLPPADVVPVVHGYWIRHDDADIVEGYYVPEYEYSKCGAWKKDDSDFCPDCGADMRDEQDDSI